MEIGDPIQAAAFTLFGLMPFGDDDSRVAIEAVVLATLAIAVALTIRLARNQDETDHLAERIGILVGAATIFCEVTGTIRLCWVLALVTASIAVSDERVIRRCSMCKLLGRTSHLRR
jgi:hypothetical protein